MLSPSRGPEIAPVERRPRRTALSPEPIHQQPSLTSNSWGISRRARYSLASLVFISQDRNLSAARARLCTFLAPVPLARLASRREGISMGEHEELEAGSLAPSYSRPAQRMLLHSRLVDLALGFLRGDATSTLPPLLV